MTEHFWSQLKISVRRCAMAYDSPTHQFENEQVLIEETDVLRVSIAGSNDAWDWLQNCNLDQVRLGQWKVSEGVLEAARNVMAMVDQYRSEYPKAYVKPLVFEGHSKGGAVAIVCGMLSAIRHNQVQQVTTFAAPRISATRIVYPFTVDRIEAKGDPVPKLPVWMPWKRWRKDGRVISIGKQTTADVAREWFGFMGRSIKRHLIAHYLEILE